MSFFVLKQCSPYVTKCLPFLFLNRIVIIANFLEQSDSELCNYVLWNVLKLENSGHIEISPLGDHRILSHFFGFGYLSRHHTPHSAGDGVASLHRFKPQSGRGNRIKRALRCSVDRRFTDVSLRGKDCYLATAAIAHRLKSITGSLCFL
ncbi:hypothetical protein BDW71DRAFT_57365 [Aspergillus fruticulosus]